MKPEHYKYHLVTRIKEYDYSKTGIYFVTICVSNRTELFCKIINGNIILNNIGVIIDNSWREIPDHFQNTTLLEHVVMPDHVHGLIGLNDMEKGTACRAVPLQNRLVSRSLALYRPLSGHLNPPRQNVSMKNGQIHRQRYGNPGIMNM